MKTTIEKVFEIDQPVNKVWNMLSNPAEIVVCVPGASITEKIDEKNYKGKVSMKFGPVKTNYAGDIEILEMDTDNKKMILKGVGLDAKGKGSAEMLMNGQVAEKEGGSEVTYSMDISITGKLAQFGARLVHDVSDQLLKQFVQNFKNELSKVEGDATDATDESLNAGSLVGGIIKDKLGGMFGGNKDA
ncbi:MAG: SRPBCC family protein [Bacteroidota bacterium]